MEGGQGSTKIHKFSYAIHSVENLRKVGTPGNLRMLLSFVTLPHSSPMAYGECWANISTIIRWVHGPNFQERQMFKRPMFPLTIGNIYPCLSV